MAAEVAGQTNGNSAHNGTSEASTQAASTNGNGSANSPTPSKDEIGWYFVEQYYTTLSKNPEKLHLFYSKRSQFVSGLEAEKAPVCVGQRAIADRIKELAIKDAKVRITNVDSQESGRDIVAQVIGEMSNKGEPHRKFVQTFILAEQPNGYFVLNDIFRYVADEDEEEVEETAAEESVESETEASAEHAEDEVETTEVIDKKLEETLAEPEIAPEAIASVDNDDTAAESEAVEAPSEVVEEKPVTPEVAAKEVEEEEKVAEEAPKDPEPTPAPASPAKQTATPAATPTPEPTSAPKASAPSAPKTWASMLAGSKTAVAIPQVPASTPAAPKGPTRKTSSTPTQEATSAPGIATKVAGLAEDAEAPPSPGGWQTAGQENSRKQHKQQSSALGGQNDNAAAYIKNVTEKVDAVLLKQALGKYGKLPYFDVNRPKNCAFVEFESHAAFQKAVSDNPHMIGGIEVIVAERHRGNTGFPPRGGARGGRGGMENRQNSQGGRGGFKNDGGRGNFANRGARGGAPAQRGRGGAQAA